MTQAPNTATDGERSGSERTEDPRAGLAVDAEVTPDLTVFRDAAPIDLETVFRTLADPGNRYILTYVLRADGEVATVELVDFVVERTGSSMRRAAFRAEVAKRLTHSLLPQLAEAGLIDYDIERQLVAATSKTRNVLPYLQVGLHQRRIQEPDDQT
jgi:hypothetical protein